MKIFNILLAIIILAAGTYGIIYMVKNDLVEEFLPGVTTAEDEEGEEEPEEERIRIIDGYKAIEMEEGLLETAGVESQKLSSMLFNPEFIAYAEAIDFTPLVALKTEYVNLLAEKRILQHDLDNLRINLRRAQALHEAKSLSARELQHHRANVDHKVAELNAMSTRIENLIYKLKSNWGNAVADMVLDPDRESDFNRLAMYDAYLIMLSLPKNRTLPSTDTNVYINHVNNRDGAVPAKYLDKASRSGNPLYGESYIYFFESEKPRPGMRLFAWILETEDTLSGLFVPDAAVIWYANEPWVYIQHDENTFVRKPLVNVRKVDDGWLLINGIGDDEPVVIRGGQTLLSEEFKWAIPDEDAD